MRFGVLGQVQVWTAGGEPVPVPETKVRALLADLLAHQKRLLSIDQLIDDLWGDELPANPTSALQLKVSRLRHALEQAEAGGGELVVSQPPGYLLKGTSDADTFIELTSEAQGIKDPRARVAMLAEALDLWRGPAFADFADEGFARRAAHRLEEQRLAALEEQAEARLELGEHTLLAAELSDLVERHPVRERLRALQMRALYRAGRQSDALAGYAQLREHLAEELGLDPSPELVALHQAILEQDPALSPPSQTDSPARPWTNLPASLTGLVGRERAVDEVRSLMGNRRLVTLTGPGGVGKTRLALEIAGRSIGRYPDGVWLVELAGHFRDATSPEVTMVAHRVAAIIGVRDDMLSDRGPVSSCDLLAGALRTKRLLLILDNCEHIVDPVARLVEQLIRAGSELRFLATSREPLALTGETVWPVPPLTLPDPSTDLCPAVLAQNSAVQLFIERVTAAMPSFTLDAGNSPHVAQLCRRLDGIPLALELAATRTPAIGVRELVSRLDDRFRLLATGRRDAPERQQTLRALIDWSWDLLTEPERVVLRRLAIHAGGCTLTAAERTCSGAGIDHGNVVEILARLIDRSLIMMADTPNGPRYRLLETVEGYCLQRLREAGEFGDVRRRFHCYYLSLAQSAEPHLRGHEQRKWLDCLDRETANLHSALDGMVRQGDAAGSLELVSALVWYWFLRGRLNHARDWLDRALTADGEAPTHLRATVRVWRECIELLTEGNVGHEARVRAAEQAFEEIENPRERARAQWFLGHALYTSISDLPTSADLVRRALATFSQIDDRWGTAAALSTATHHAMVHGDLRAIEEYGDQSSQLFSELGDRWGQLQIVGPLAYHAEALGDYERATRLHSEGRRIAENLELWSDVSDRIMHLGRIALLRRDFAQSRDRHERARSVAIEHRYERGEYHYEVGLALIERREGQLELAEERLHRLLQRQQNAASVQGRALLLAELGFIAEQRGDGETALSRHLQGLVAARATDNLRAIALALEGLAGAHTLLGRCDETARLLGTADAARRSAGVPLPPAERADVDRSTARALAALGEGAFAAEFRRGACLDLDVVLSAFDGGPLSDGLAAAGRRRRRDLSGTT
ncbi:BTAD domain-containing putative transcriptional regulator [Nonomuraea sp. KM88]|uniref:BTAD domain-containing putative transcriptional regulator n=1 Tax=Nonomuraea sp. KM88 TaxID=3457427 RepID=UPI003FCC5EBA